jgi:hypothetical protein
MYCAWNSSYNCSYIGGLNPDKEILDILSKMADYKIQLFGEHNLLKFHTGFSFMMGFLLSAFGFQNLMVVNSINKKSLISIMIITAIALVLSIVYFHLLATLFIFTSLMCYFLSYKKI